MFTAIRSVFTRGNTREQTTPLIPKEPTNYINRSAASENVPDYILNMPTAPGTKTISPEEAEHLLSTMPTAPTGFAATTFAPTTDFAATTFAPTTDFAATTFAPTRDFDSHTSFYPKMEPTNLDQSRPSAHSLSQFEDARPSAPSFHRMPVQSKHDGYTKLNEELAEIPVLTKKEVIISVPTIPKKSFVRASIPESITEVKPAKAKIFKDTFVESTKKVAGRSAIAGAAVGALPGFILDCIGAKLSGKAYLIPSTIKTIGHQISGTHDDSETRHEHRNYGWKLSMFSGFVIGIPLGIVCGIAGGVIGLIGAPFYAGYKAVTA